jgi:ABC-type uncharacterized transport system permease subunit
MVALFSRKSLIGLLLVTFLFGHVFVGESDAQRGVYVIP